MTYKFIVLVLLLFLLFITDVLIGSANIPLRDFIDVIVYGNDETVFHSIIHDFRIPKAITAILAGTALSVSGLQMQAIFRNPLAGPYVFGISSGASLGVALVILGLGGAISSAFLGNLTVAAAACLGAALVLLAILLVSLRVKNVMTILILGILVGNGISAIVSILQYFSNESMLKSFIIWTMGSLGAVTRFQLGILIPVILTGLLIAFFLSKFLNLLLMGEHYAKTMGIRILLVRVLTFLSTSLLAGSITAFCGPIGFIGIAVPHLTRIFFSSANHFILLPGTILTGSCLMLISDLISQTPGVENTLPINSITALFGIPIVIWIILRKQNFIEV